MFNARSGKQRPSIVTTATHAGRAHPESLSLPSAGGETGFLVTDLKLAPLYANSAAIQILGYGTEAIDDVVSDALLQAQLRSIFQTSALQRDVTVAAPFMSGRRQYVCRSFTLDAREVEERPPRIALVIERAASRQWMFREFGERYNLSPRECETVLHLTEGLTTKEIASRMRVSPNTVKQFMRLVMCKLDVTTRSGILGKLLSR
jgi:DNA-binding CsgD family transcriptional regulator